MWFAPLPGVQQQKTTTLTIWICLGMLLTGCGVTLRAAETNVAVQVQQLLLDNAAMRGQMQKQQELIDTLTHEVAKIHKAETVRYGEVSKLKEEVKEPDTTPVSANGFSLGKVRISGEGGVGFFESGYQGMFPNAEFRVDEAKLFVEAPVWGDVYAYTELDLATHESSSQNATLGEYYLDFESVSQLWHRDRQLNIRVGNLYIPFGEEYATRNAIDNPLISHSLSDFWGVDEGIEFYGSFGKFSYVAAVQNGGVSTTSDFTADKSVTGRVGYDPTPWLHLSASAMRTGDLDANNDGLSAMWFGCGWFRSLGSTNTTRFHANAVEGDVELRLPCGSLKTFGGYISYGDNDPTQNNHRNVYYYAIEGTHNFTRNFYAAAQFSQIFAKGGFPIVGEGQMGQYLFGPLTDQIWRLSLGLGYRFSPHLILKTEYTFEQGTESTGEQRNHENQFATEAVFGF